MTNKQKVIRAKVGMLELAKQATNKLQSRGLSNSPFAVQVRHDLADINNRLKALKAMAAQDRAVPTGLLVALEMAKSEKEPHGQFEGEYPGSGGEQDTFYIGNIKGVGPIYQQTFIDTYSRLAFAKLYDRVTPLTAADLLIDRVVPFFDEQGVPLRRVLTACATQYCGDPHHHEYELYLTINNINHITKTMSSQPRGICERFYQTALEEFYCVALRKTIYGNIAALQVDLDEWVATYNNSRAHQGPWCHGKTPMQTWLDAQRFPREK